MNHDITATQQAVLAYAHEHHHGQVLWFPDTVKGGARTKIVESLTTRGFIAQTEQGLTLTDAGYAALGITPPAAQTAQPKAPREHSKQAQVIANAPRAPPSSRFARPPAGSSTPCAGPLPALLRSAAFRYPPAKTQVPSASIALQ
jgi:hypothetical protein